MKATTTIFTILVLLAVGTIRSDPNDEEAAVEVATTPDPDGHGIHGLWNKAQRFYGRMNQYLDPQDRLKMDQVFGHMTTFLRQVHNNPQEIVQTLKKGIDNARQQARNDQSVKKLTDEFDRIKRKVW
uniref:Uncharacterized protein n=1 Tax=Romanomermis culicivorax TaxID=13658 RepID=A0A915KN35_ROMCU